jgi:hypothetical protein
MRPPCPLLVQKAPDAALASPSGGQAATPRWPGAGCGSAPAPRTAGGGSPSARCRAPPASARCWGGRRCGRRRTSPGPPSRRARWRSGSPRGSRPPAGAARKMRRARDNTPFFAVTRPARPHRRATQNGSTGGKCEGRVAAAPGRARTVTAMDSPGTSAISSDHTRCRRMSRWLAFSEPRTPSPSLIEIASRGSPA